MGLWRRKRQRTTPPGADHLLERHLGEWAHLDGSERTQLRGDIETLLTTKSWEAASGFTLTDDMCTVIAAQAALLTLGLDLELYRHVKAIVVHPTTITVTVPRPGPIRGSITEEPVDLLGEAHGYQGPVILAWDAVRRETRWHGTGRNVVIHEMAHKLDMLDGVVDGTPPMVDDATHRRWVAVCTPVYESLRRGDPDPILRDYGATDPGEFFAVVAEVFFDRPLDLAEHHPDLYRVFSDYFQQDPIARRLGVAHEPAG